MSASLALAVVGQVYSSKSMESLAVEKYGYSGWWKNPDTGELVCVVYVKTVGANCAAWVPADLHREKIKDQKTKNYRFYMANPHLRALKINEKRKPTLFSRYIWP